MEEINKLDSVKLNEEDMEVVANIKKIVIDGKVTAKHILTIKNIQARYSIDNKRCYISTSNGKTSYKTYERKKVITESIISQMKEDLKTISLKEVAVKYNLSQPTIKKYTGYVTRPYKKREN